MHWGRFLRDGDVIEAGDHRPGPQRNPRGRRHEDDTHAHVAPPEYAGALGPMPPSRAGVARRPAAVHGPVRHRPRGISRPALPAPRRRRLHGLSTRSWRRSSVPRPTRSPARRAPARRRRRGPGGDAHALDELGLDGVLLLSSVRGHIPRRPLPRPAASPSSTAAAPTSSCTRASRRTTYRCHIRCGSTSSSSRRRVRWRT